MINEVWANRLVAGTKTWAEMPVNRQNAVTEILKQRVASGELSNSEYKKITGKVYKT